MMEWYLTPWKKFADFAGRARRREYWFFALGNFVIAIVLSFVERSMGLANAEYGAGALVGLFSLAVLIPGIAVTIRRLHDTNRSGWWILLGLIPIANLVLLVFMLLDGTAGSNDYGSDPKGRGAAVAEPAV